MDIVLDRVSEACRQAKDQTFPMQGEAEAYQEADGASSAQQVTSLDKAVSTLAAASQAGQLLGTMYGRLHSIVKLKSASSSEPVNAILHEICRMVSCSATLPWTRAPAPEL